MKNLSLGTLGNSIAGIIGDGLGGQLPGMLGISTVAGGMDIGSIIASIAGGGVGGGALMAIVALIKKSISR